MTALPNTQESFLDTISNLILSNDSKRSYKAFKTSKFPLRINIDIANSSNATDSVQAIKNQLTKLDIQWNLVNQLIDFSVSDKDTSSVIINYLLEHRWSMTLDYSHFMTHPGMLFVKGLQQSLNLSENVRKFFSKKSQYGLLAEVNIIGIPGEDIGNEVAAILKFDNYLDADKILAQPNTCDNPFGPKGLSVSRYISKRERSILLTEGNNYRRSHSAYAMTNEETVMYDTIVVENFNDFIPGTLSLEQFETILEKFELFLSIEEVFFPVTNQETDKLRFKKVGFIGLSPDKETSTNLLKSLYYLNDLTLTELLAFSKQDIYDLSKDISNAEQKLTSKSPKLKLSIAQRKHNRHLYENTDSFYVRLNDKVAKVCEPDLNLHESGFINRFVKSFNYQETNVYVNNFPIIFENDDALWAEFWNQFGVDRIKSAKIIKPQFYSKKSNGPLGKIGFVFYEEFKMALRAIILTNNKVIKYQNCPSILIQASFAIQKHSSNSQPSSKLTQPRLHHSNANYHSESETPIPTVLGAGCSPFVSLPEHYLFHPYTVSMAPYTSSIPPDRLDGDGSDFHRLADEAEMHLGSNSYPSYFGYYFPYFPYSGQMPIGGPIPPHMPVNIHPINMAHQMQHSSENKLERKNFQR